MAIRDLGLPPEEPRKPYVVPPRKSPRWKRIVPWIAGISLLLSLVVVIGVYAVLHSTRFHDYVLRTAQRKASASLNTRVDLQNYSLHLSNLGLDLYGMTVYGVGPGANQPLLQVDHVGLGVRVISVLHRQWNLDNVAVDHPVVNLIVDANGNTNIPTPQSSGSSNTNVFDLAVQHILLDRGAIYYNDRKTPLNADLRDLTLRSSYDSNNGGGYHGTLSYRDGHLQYGSYSPLPHDLDAQFDARRTAMTLSNVTLKLGQSQLLLNASLDNYSRPRVHASYVMTLALGELRRIMNDPSLPNGAVIVEGDADYTNSARQAALNATSLKGTIHSQLLQVRTASLNTDIRDLGATYSLSNGNAELHNVTARLLGGALTADATMRDIAGKQQGHVVAAMRGISLAELTCVANSSGLKPVVITGYVNANSDATWTGSIKTLQGRADAVADGKLSSTQAAATGNSAPMPMQAEIHARYDGQAQEVALNKSFVRMPHTSLDMNGTVSERSALSVNLQSSDLHELETVAGMFTEPTQPLNLYGAASFNGTVRGSTSAPQIAGQLNGRNLRVRGTTFRLLRTNLQASPAQISLQNGDLELANQQGRMTFDVQSGLDDWSHTPSSPFTVNARATQVSILELAHAANVTTPITGTLNANIDAHGTQVSPVGQGDVSLRNAVISGEPVKAAEVRFNGTGDEVHANLSVQISAGNAQGQLTYYPKQEGYDAVLRATNIKLGQLQSLRQRNLEVKGTLNLTASGRGTLNDPQGTASLTIPELDIQKQQIRNIIFQGNVANHEARFTLGSEVVATPLRAQGRIALVGDYDSDVTVDTPVIPLQPLLAAYAPAQAALVNGQTELHATLRGPLKNQKLLLAHLNIPTLAVSYRTPASSGAQPATLQIAAVNPIRADYVDGVLSLQPGEIKGTGTDIRYQGRLPLDSSAESTLKVQGDVDLAIAEIFDPTHSTGGKLVFDINAEGYRSQPNVQGQIRIVQASFSTPDAPIGLSDGNGVLTLRNDRIDITQFSGSVGGGTVTASGGVAYRPNIQFAIGLKGNDLRLLYPANVRTDLGLNLAMTGNMDVAQLQGQIEINQLYFTPDFDLSTFMTQFGGVATPPPTEGFADNLKLNIAVRSSSELSAASPTVSIQGAANLRVVGSAADPVIVGRANLTGGDVIFMGNRYVVQGGSIAFVNNAETTPIVNLQASTTIQQYNISMRFRGPLNRLHTNYTSDPALPPADIIHLLAFGNTEEAANAAPAQSTTLGAESLVASQVSSQVTSRLQKALGVSQISLDPQLGATTGNQQQGARLTVRQRVSGKLYVTFSTDVTTTEFSAIQLQYQLNRKWSLSGVRDQNGGFGLDGRYHKDF